MKFKRERFERVIFGRAAVFDKHPAFIPLNIGMVMVMLHQPKDWKPRKPSTDQGLAMFEEVQRSLEANGLNLRLFNALGAPIDHHFGIAGFFELNGSVATFDLTANPGKEKKPSVDIVIREQTISNQWKRHCHHIAKLLLERRREIY